MRLLAGSMSFELSIIISYFRLQRADFLFFVFYYKLDDTRQFDNRPNLSSLARRGFVTAEEWSEIVESENNETAYEAQTGNRRRRESDVVRVEKRLQRAIVDERQTYHPDCVIQEYCRRHYKYDLPLLSIALQHNWTIYVVVPYSSLYSSSNFLKSSSVKAVFSSAGSSGSLDFFWAREKSFSAVSDWILPPLRSSSRFTFSSVGSILESRRFFASYTVVFLVRFRVMASAIDNKNQIA